MFVFVWKCVLERATVCVCLHVHLQDFYPCIRMHASVDLSVCLCESICAQILKPVERQRGEIISKH